MKKELFNRIIEMLSKERPLSSRTETEEYILVNFEINNNTTNINWLKDRMANLPENNVAARDFSNDEQFKKLTHKEIFAMAPSKNYHNEWLSVNYDVAKDKISVARFETGWKWAAKKGRFYPYKKNSPSLCYSKQLYSFMWFRKSPTQWFYKPKLMKGQDMMGPYTDVIAKMMLGIDFKPTTNLLAKHYMNAKDEWEVVHRQTGIKVPKALRVFQIQEMVQFIQVLKNPNELSTLCQHLASHPSNFPSTTDKPELIRSYSISHDLYARLSEMMFLTPDKSWLLRDYVSDHMKLKRKFSLKVSSLSRIEDEHRKMTKEIMMLGIKEIKVAEHYKEMFENFPIADAELILNKKRLMQESLEQDHCVATYGEKINNGQCCIVSIMWEDVRYTMEIRKMSAIGVLDQSLFIIQQCKGYRNQTNGPSDMLAIVSSHFNANFNVSPEGEQVPAQLEQVNW